MPAPPTRTSSIFPPLLATDLTRSYAGRTVLDGIDLRAAPGQRIGIVGENGTGKSTLLHLLAGVEDPDSGTIVRPSELAYLPQEPVLSGTVAQTLTAALAPLHAAVRAVERLSTALAGDPAAGPAFAGALEWAQAHGAWDADRRATVAADRLGLALIDPGREVRTLSGGERTRLALAAVITTRPGCLLLDEPTNHLDDDAMELLEEFLIGLPGIVVAASHDRVFLDRVCTEIVDLDPTAFGTDGLGGRRFRGDFSQYLAQKAAARRRWELSYAEQQETIANLRRASTIDTGSVAPGRGPRDNDKFIYAFKGSKVDRAVARRVHDAHRRLASAERNQLRRPPAPLVFRAPLPGAAGPRDRAVMAVRVRDLQVPGRVSMARLDVPNGGRLLLTGANGSGKSSLLAVLASRLEAAGGTVSVTAGRVGLLPQDVVFADPGRSAGETFAAAVEADLTSSLTSLGILHPCEIVSPVGTLSVGQQRRLGLAILLAQDSDLVLLDEPTNHISLTLAAELEQALGTSTRTVIVASHDRWLRRRWDGPVQPM